MVTRGCLPHAEALRPSRPRPATARDRDFDPVRSSASTASRSGWPRSRPSRRVLLVTRTQLRPFFRWSQDLHRRRTARRDRHASPNASSLFGDTAAICAIGQPSFEIAYSVGHASSESIRLSPSTLLAEAERWASVGQRAVDRRARVIQRRLAVAVVVRGRAGSRRTRRRARRASASAWSRFAVAGQLSRSSAAPSPSRSDVAVVADVRRRLVRSNVVARRRRRRQFVGIRHPRSPSVRQRLPLASSTASSHIAAASSRPRATGASAFAPGAADRHAGQPVRRIGVSSSAVLDRSAVERRDLSARSAAAAGHVRRGHRRAVVERVRTEPAGNRRGDARRARRRRRCRAEVREVRGGSSFCRTRRRTGRCAGSTVHGYCGTGRCVARPRRCPPLPAATTNSVSGCAAIAARSVSANAAGRRGCVHDADAVLAGAVEGLDAGVVARHRSSSSTRSGMTCASGATPATPRRCRDSQRSCHRRECRGRSRRAASASSRRSRDRRAPGRRGPDARRRCRSRRRRPSDRARC